MVKSYENVFYHIVLHSVVLEVTLNIETSLSYFHHGQDWQPPSRILDTGSRKDTRNMSSNMSTRKMMKLQTRVTRIDICHWSLETYHACKNQHVPAPSCTNAENSLQESDTSKMPRRKTIL